MKADELCLNSMDAGHPDIYISGDDDAESPDLRLSFVHAYGVSWHDMPPHRLAALRDLIDEALRGVGHWTPPDQSEVEAEQQRTDLAMLVGRLMREAVVRRRRLRRVRGWTVPLPGLCGLDG